MNNNMKTLRECIKEAAEKKVAVGHFNISNLEALWGIFNAAKSLDVPVIIGVSEGERDFVGVAQAVALVKSFREKFNYPIFLNADHTYSVDRVKEAIDAGFDSVIFDGAKLSLEENISLTKQCVEYARASGRDVLVEGELGYIGQSSKILDAIPEGVELDESMLTHAEEAKRFVTETGVDMLAPAVGNIHGMLRSGTDPKLNITRVKEISEATGVPLVLHGGSGNSKEDFRDAVASGVSVVHINTEIRVAYRDALKKSLQDNPDEVAPYKILKPAVAGVEKVVLQKLKTFNNLE
jgi:fructose-bisphosphate aldolase class II